MKTECQGGLCTFYTQLSNAGGTVRCKLAHAYSALTCSKICVKNNPTNTQEHHVTNLRKCVRGVLLPQPNHPAPHAASALAGQRAQVSCSRRHRGGNNFIAWSLSSCTSPCGHGPMDSEN